MTTFYWQVAAFVVYFLYSSFFEWTLHRFVFHTPKYNYSMFRKHTLVHHQIYKSDETYHSHDDDPDSVPMNWWALPMMLAFHAPFFFLIQWVTGIPSVWGGLAAIATYFAIYESIHWTMHVPRAAQFLQRFRAYRFLDAHHRAHHKYMLSNLNVVLPLADLTFGTLRTENGKRIGPRAHDCQSDARHENRRVICAAVYWEIVSVKPRLVHYSKAREGTFFTGFLLLRKTGINKTRFSPPDFFTFALLCHETA